ncbi:MAG: DUF1853 family protein [Gammaproteobacteria bacterium]
MTTAFIRYNAAMAYAYKHPAVRDLAWSIGSPALVQVDDSRTTWKTTEWFTEIHEAYRPFLKQLDQQPDELLLWLAECPCHRLGSYFEKLWGFWLTTNKRYRLLQANLPVRDLTKTIGEFDFLVEDTRTGEHQHWELAVKFYLGVGKLDQTCHWWGPMKRDRLDLKLTHMQQQQCRLSEHPEGQRLLAEKGIEVTSRCAIMKGRLFYPLNAPGIIDAQWFGNLHLQGWWTTRSEFTRQANPNGQFKSLDKVQWLSEIQATDNLQPLEDTLRHLEDARQPKMIAILQGRKEISRGFITPDHWSDSIQKQPGRST